MPLIEEDSASRAFTSFAARSVGVVVVLTLVLFVTLAIGGTVMLYGSGMKGTTSLAWLLVSIVGALKAREARTVTKAVLNFILSADIDRDACVKSD